MNKTILQYPYQGNNDVYDGRGHNIKPQRLSSTIIPGIFILEYYDYDLEESMVTILARSGNTFFKVPLNDYDELFNNFVQSGRTNDEDINILPDNISTLSITSFAEIVQDYINSLSPDKVPSLINYIAYQYGIKPNKFVESMPTIGQSQLPPDPPSSPPDNNREDKDNYRYMYAFPNKKDDNGDIVISDKEEYLFIDRSRELYFVDLYTARKYSDDSNKPLGVSVDLEYTEYSDDIKSNVHSRRVLRRINEDELDRIRLPFKRIKVISINGLEVKVIPAVEDENENQYIRSNIAKHYNYDDFVEYIGYEDSIDEYIDVTPVNDDLTNTIIDNGYYPIYRADSFVSNLVKKDEYKRQK